MVSCGLAQLQQGRMHVARYSVEVSLNLLAFFKADEGWMFGQEEESELTPNDVLEFLCRPQVEPTLKSIVNRYNEISGKELNPSDRLAITPAESKILNRLVLPLGNAMKSYMIGNYLGTVALCGVVCEMLAIFQFALTKPSNTKMKAFERLNQSQRIDTLYSMGKLTNQNYSDLKKVLKLRNRHLHWWSKTAGSEKDDAKEAFEKTRKTMSIILKIKIDNGKVILRHDVIEFILQASKAEQN